MTQPKVVLDDEDEFEDFPVQDSSTDLKQLPKWQDTWEDDDTTVDFAVQLAKEKTNKDQQM
ncbi:hypothetical protein HDV06_003505 [Boothiomyces sp. JEL0866]|nr:hypothetical protein HDV06_003474 [Boothiomyces sp. JEL0866]KAJ3325735.1 hypothetical protein HDV06_003505 [Boothiomyces sp. JEL0866]